MISKVQKLISNSISANSHLDKIDQMLVQETLSSLRKSPRYSDSKSLIPHGYKMYSQSDEDGLIREIFNRIGTSNKIFIEFGVGNGLENNTFSLLFEGWSGLWIEGSEVFADEINEGLKSVIASKQLQLTREYITRDNIERLISDSIAEPEIDLLSIDIDGNDLHIFNAINCVKPRVVVIEYNCKFPPPIRYCMEYAAEHGWARDDCFGASLKAFEIDFSKKGYSLVGCSLSGVNAFFVRTDLLGDHFLAPYTAENHYEPARYFLTCVPSGHPPSHSTLERSVKSP